MKEGYNRKRRAVDKATLEGGKRREEVGKEGRAGERKAGYKEMLKRGANRGEAGVACSEERWKNGRLWVRGARV